MFQRRKAMEGKQRQHSQQRQKLHHQLEQMGETRRRSGRIARQSWAHGHNLLFQPVTKTVHMCMSLGLRAPRGWVRETGQVAEVRWTERGE